ncbi:NADH-quinone oxidoreductase subunit K [Aliidiomarina haloalkalitolerans]|uniref:Na+/H+ antiporter subunit C n=1 Tax=Aliidiomarina haloalkalitolerans TaxID=859059 RepID=A0A432VR19_9GAMM|nr:NADH-quinone oxidoreductase subunit K [Aliidiomarina haloalkalitolerans]RUO18712.1 Na+/H+ antiporter subunit C [Aliidiomarina haloalkalitolerans]
MTLWLEAFNTDFWYAIVGAVLLVLALGAFITSRQLIKKLLAFNIMGSGVFLIMVGLAQYQHGPDSVPQALVLTGIVVAVAATALALVLIRKFVLKGGQP